jgi:hypothetical protein
LSDAHLESSSDSSQGRNWWLWGSLALAVLIVGAVFFGGDGSSSPGIVGGHVDSTETPLARSLFDSATDTLDRLEQFETDPALRLVIDRLNQWSRLEPPNDPWTLDPLVEQLPSEPPLKDLPILKTAGRLKFQPDDGNHLLETNWLRNIARMVRGEQSDDLSRAVRLFDWTVRNLQLEDWSIRRGTDVAYRPARIEAKDKKNDVSYLAREVLLFGRGDYVHRAWIFALLGRQENLEVVLLAVPDRDGPHGLRPWLPALLHHGELYLFDTYLGLPLRDADGEIATLKQVQADPSLLRALDTPDEVYPLGDEDLKHVVALVEGSPAYLLRRMQAVESRLAGHKKVVLSARPTAIAEKLSGLKEVAEVRLWPHPYEVLHERNQATPEQMQTIGAAMSPFMLRYPTPRARDRRVALAEEHPLFTGQSQAEEFVADQAPLEIQWCSLWMGRVMHFKGNYASEGKLEGAHQHYLASMIVDTDMERMIQEFERVAGMRDQKTVQDFRANMREVIPRAKQNAIYWLGLIAHDRGIHSASQDFLKRAADRQLDGPWRHGAIYNLARSYEEQAAAAKDPQEAEKLLQEAIRLLQSDKESAQSLGNLIRARTLQAKVETSRPAEANR